MHHSKPNPASIFRLLKKLCPATLLFDNELGEIIHVGIIGKNKIIHSSGKVRIDNIDHKAFIT